ncbi:hypothetical protein [Chondromyces apiculatus]|uniref:Esterase n=1 Tax=Chondromyces apiculatus DSM 436 TaxID=1192034 RepID=A0A017TBS7_9BACT|nr:hypothetical protein [Chondromyces apiculatus]EYF06377.1 Hypothetical protein CAP_1907 [Chondromyces apiculatus DSM 436]
MRRTRLASTRLASTRLALITYASILACGPATPDPAAPGASPSAAQPPASPSGAPSGAPLADAKASTALRFTVRFGPELSAASLDGRLLLFLATRPGEEPRFQVTGANDTAQVFGIDLDSLAPGKPAVIDDATLGYPVARLADLPPGDYHVQALLHRYETFRRGDGHTVKLPPDRGEGQQWSLAPGNLLSAPVRMHLDPARGGDIALTLDRALPELPPMRDTKYLKHVRIRSERLSRFWGRDTYLGAQVLLPEGWDTHPDAHYPLAILHSHFDRGFFGWREQPPDADLPPVNLEGIARECPNGHGPRCAPLGYRRVVQEAGHRFYKQWTGPGFPRVLLVQIQHANPYYDDSYAVNSENLGPYGDAITHELIPHLERTFRGLGPWARGMYGGSTGGWEALAAQIFYPDDYNGAVASCPDPIDFHHFVSVNIYEDRNAYWSEGPLRRTPRPANRGPLGYTVATMEQDNLLELVLGTHSRSGGQFDIWEAVFSPVGPDGYPRRLYDRRTGVIDPEVAQAWHRYDLGHILERDWATLGPKLQGKLWINVGRMDNYFLDGAVTRVECFLRSTRNPASDAVIAYGATDGHCWNGDPTTLNAHSRLRYHERFIPQLVTRWLASAPKGADVKSWRY